MDDLAFVEDQMRQLLITNNEITESYKALAVTPRQNNEDEIAALIIHHRELIEERRGLQDHALALRVRDGTQGTQPLNEQQLETTTTCPFNESECQLCAAGFQDAVQTSADSSTPSTEIPSTTPTRPLEEPESVKSEEPDEEPEHVSYLQCGICADHVREEELYRDLPCHHDHCADCAERLFRNAFKNEKLFPPRCCGHHFDRDVSVTLIRRHDITIEKYDEKSIEFGTSKRVYCHSCSKFLGSEETFEDKKASCVDCCKVTCSACKAEAHTGECDEDPGAEALQKYAKEKKLQRCEHCKALIELNQGCNHMTCRCGYQFCYLCGKKWRTCDCPPYVEELLAHEARRIQERIGQRQGREMDYLAARQYVIENHICDHWEDLWIRIEGHHTCHSCHAHLRGFIFQCGACSEQRCHECLVQGRHEAQRR